MHVKGMEKINGCHIFKLPSIAEIMDGSKKRH